MRKHLPAVILLILFSLLAGAPAWAKSKPPAVNNEGMRLVEDSDLATVYADPDADLGAYKRIWLQDATVAFKKNWKRDQNRTDPFKVDDKDMDRIRKDMASIFHEVLTKKLKDAGYQMATGPGDDVLKIVPAIVDLNVVAPDVDRAATTYTYSEWSGEMTLNLDMYDSMTGDKIVTATDHKSDYYQYGYFQWRTSVSNRADAKRMMKGWAKGVVALLDEARKTVKQKQAPATTSES